MPIITLLPDNRILQAEAGQTLHNLLAREGMLDAPCGGRGTCGKCRVLANGREVPACQTTVDRDMTVVLPSPVESAEPAAAGSRIAFDIGTTTVVCFLADEAGNVLARASARNPQTAFGADVISRIQAAQAGNGPLLTDLIRRTATGLLLRVCSTPEAVQVISMVGNPAMQQLFLGLPVDNLAQLPYAPILCKSEITSAAHIFPCCPQAQLLTVPDISGFVGADTVAGILACGLPDSQGPVLLVDIGTNGEMVLADKGRMLACSTAAGPALEGSNITMGMGAEAGAIDRVWIENGALHCRVMGGIPAVGICGSGLLDAVAAALDLGLLNRRGQILNGDNKIMLTNQVYLTQEDIRQVQLAKGAIAAGIRLMAAQMNISLGDIQQVCLAGAFGSCLDPESACRTGLLPEELLPKITAAGNTAGQGALLLAAHPERLSQTQDILQNTRFLELASLPAFPRTFAKAMELPQNWCRTATALGFTQAAVLNPACLQAREDVRAMCAQDRCGAYGKNWTCPPHCGTVAQCQMQMQGFSRGILLQTVGHLSKDIDSRGWLRTEQQHLESFSRFCQAIRRQHPQALCLGTGSCRVCKVCAWPEACRFPKQAVSSMEGYGLFVTQVCRDAGLPYHHGERTVTYTACVLY